eukprot:150008-Amphidinium_carterae.1
MLPSRDDLEMQRHCPSKGWSLSKPSDGGKIAARDCGVGRLWRRRIKTYGDHGQSTTHAAYSTCAVTEKLLCGTVIPSTARRFGGGTLLCGHLSVVQDDMTPPLVWQLPLRTVAAPEGPPPSKAS